MTTTIVEGGVHTADSQAEHIRYFEPTVTQTVTQVKKKSNSLIIIFFGNFSFLLFQH